MDALLQAFQLVFEPKTVLVMLGASAFGLFVGAVPGLTATMATALLVPVTFFIGRDGTISRKHFGPVSKEQVEREIKALL